MCNMCMLSLVSFRDIQEGCGDKTERSKRSGADISSPKRGLKGNGAERGVAQCRVVHHGGATCSRGVEKS